MASRRKAPAARRARKATRSAPLPRAKPARIQSAAREGWKCAVCGRWHEELPMGFGASEPELASRVPEEEKAERVVNDGETCGVDEHFFIKGSMEIPVKGVDWPFVWTVWVRLEQDDFDRAIDLWQNPARIREEPYVGRLGTRIPVYPETLHLEARVHTREVGKRPFVELTQSDHPLSKEQRKGITLARIREIAEVLLHTA